MKVGGNASFNDFLNRHPGSYSASSTDMKERYTSRAATLYKEELAKRCADDEKRYGPKVFVEGAMDSAVTEDANAKDADFFDTWDAPPAVKKPVSSSNPTATPPLISLGGLSSGGSPLNSRPTTPRVPSSTSISSTVANASGASTPTTSNPPAAPRTVTSSSLRTTSSATTTTSTARPKMTLGARSTSSTTGASSGPVGRGKLGVKKGGVVNFEEAERKAREEEERIKKLGYDERQEREAEEAARTAAAAASAASSTSRGGAVSGSGYSPNGKNASKRDSIETERLGMGIKRLGFGQVHGVSGADAAKEAARLQKIADRKARGFDDEQERKSDG